MTLGDQLRRHTALRQKLWPIYASHPLGQSYYFELFVDIDYLVLHHAEGISIYGEHKRTPEARLFVACLNFLAVFLKDCAPVGKQLYEKIAATTATADIHPTPLGRKVAAMILYEHHTEGAIRLQTLRLVDEIREQIPASGPLGEHLPTYHTLVAEAFNWCGRHDEALQVASLALEHYPTDHTYVGISFHQQLLVHSAIALAKCDRVDEAWNTFAKVKPYLFDVHARQFNLINYYLLESVLRQLSGDRRLAKEALEQACTTAHRLQYNGLIEKVFPLFKP